MDSVPEHIWIAACAHQLQQRWRTADPKELEAVAEGLYRDSALRPLGPCGAAVEWLKPVGAGAAAPIN